ncbi:MAG TPA: lysylphosphatidylglycerol synthase domain-containing protein [Anaerolineales bacterium]|nr:lysylphosphatidylglycerol synthase domain-containing protein [Anaerolineales bacterium]
MRKWIDYSWDKLNSAYQNQKTRRLLFLGILLLSLFFIALALRANWSEFKAQDLNFDYRFIILAVLIYPVGMLPTALSWHTLLRTIGVALPFRTNLRIFSLSALPRHIPGFVWYISSRSLLYKEENTPAAVIVTASAADIILLALTGFLSTLMLLVSGIGISQDLNSIRTAAYIAIPILLLLIISIPLVNRLLPYLLEMRGVTEIPSIHQGYLVVTLLIMFIAWAGGGLILFVLAQAIYPLSWSMYPALIGAWGAAGAVSLTVGIGIQGLGIREITLSAILSLIMPPVIAIILAVVFRLVLTVGEFLWVMLFIWLTKKPPEKIGGSVS